MSRVTLKSMKDCGIIFANEDAVILSGKHPWIFRRDGTFVAKLKTVRNAYGMIFLPNRTVLMHGGGDFNYHYVSLDDGSILHSWPAKGQHSTPNIFAASPDGETVFYIYSKGSSFTKYVDVFHLQDLTQRTYVLTGIQGVIQYCYCDNDGNLIILHDDLPSQPVDADPDSGPWRVYSITQWSYQQECAIVKHQWIKKTQELFLPKMCDEKYLLLKDLKVVSIEDGTEFSLLENNPPINRGPGGCTFTYDSDRSLLTVCFISSGSNVIIDCVNRKIVAHYVPQSYQMSFGCLVGDEFWIGSREGVIRRPFPYMDDFPRLL